MTLQEQHSHLLSILRSSAVTILFQPVVSTIERKIVGYEALARGPSNSPLHAPLMLFAAAKFSGLLTEMESLCRRKAVMAFCGLRLQGLLFLNVSPERLLEQSHHIQQQPSLNSLAVLTDDNHPVGTVHCHELSQIMLKPYAKELHGRKPIHQMVAADSLVIDVNQSLQRVSRLLTSRARQRLEEDFVITQNGCYLGMGRVIDVLRHITELQIRQAQAANPLTLLPGNISIHECLKRLLDNKLTAHVCYIDLDSFKPFNDIYGYGKGDQVLLGLAQILKELCDPDYDFVGHIGGDDFLLVLRTLEWRKQLAELERGLNRRIVTETGANMHF